MAGERADPSTECYPFGELKLPAPTSGSSEPPVTTSPGHQLLSGPPCAPVLVIPYHHTYTSVN